MSVLPGSVRRGDHHAVDLTAAQHLELGALLVRILSRTAQQQAVAALAGDRFDAGDDLDEERVHQIGITMPSVWVRRRLRLRATALR
jgi:hypothetical protein